MSFGLSFDKLRISLRTAFSRLLFKSLMPFDFVPLLGTTLRALDSWFREWLKVLQAPETASETFAKQKANRVVEMRGITPLSDKCPNILLQVYSILCFKSLAQKLTKNQ